MGKTVDLVLRICEPIFSTGKFVALDSVLCVWKGITVLLEFGIYAATLIKKQEYWPKGVPGYVIYQYVSDKDVTYFDTLETINEEGTEGKAFNIFCFNKT